MSTSGLLQALHALTATAIVQATRSEHTTCEAVARACLDHIAVREPAVQAWQYLNGDQVIAQAHALDRRGYSGPLHGVPFGIKDIIDTCDMPTEYGSPIYRGHQPVSDAACVALSRQARGHCDGQNRHDRVCQCVPGQNAASARPATHAWSPAAGLCCGMPGQRAGGRLGCACPYHVFIENKLYCR